MIHHSNIADRFSLPDGDWEDAIRQRREQPARRWADEEVEELRELNRRFDAPDPVMRHIDALARPDTLVIVTGQQAGLALGPLYTLYKALGAILHARHVAEKYGVPVAPCFWIASEDHDFAEVRDVHWLGADGQKESFRYAPQNLPENRSMTDVPIEESLFKLPEQLASTTPDSAHKQEVLAWLNETIRRSSNLEDFFGRTLEGLLGRYGLIALSPQLLALRRQACDFLEMELRAPSETSRAMIRAGQMLAERGYTPALHREEHDINFFLYVGRRRCKLFWSGERIGVDCENGVEEITPGELIEQVRQDPRRLSTNVVSRPLTQDAALPTFAYVAGPGEISYFAQLREVYSLWRVGMPLIVPRPRVVLTDARTRRFFEKTQTSLQDLLREDPRAFENRFLADDHSQPLEKLQQAQAQFEAVLEELTREMKAVSPAAEKAVARLAEAQTKGLHTIRERVQQELRLRNDVQIQRLQRIEEFLRPGGHPQERIYSVLSPLLIQYGFDAVEKIASAIDLSDRELQVVDL